MPMNATKRERVVVSVGGSLIVPGKVDTVFLSHFRDLITRKVAKGYSFAIIAGGGSTAREYQATARAILGDIPREDLDWLGIHATRMNGHLLRTIFHDGAHPQLIKDPTAPLDARESIIVAAGWKPGWSTDYCAVMIAKQLGAKRLVNLSNIDCVYDSDPKKNASAKKIPKISWREFRKIIPDHWDPGLSSPFDPVAAKEAERLGLEVAIINGAELERFADYLDGEDFEGTIIS